MEKMAEVMKKAGKGTLEQEVGEERVKLSPRQQDILGGIVEGLNAVEIGVDLGLSPGYVRNVIRVLYEKAGAAGGGRFTARARLVRWAVENGWGSGD